MPEGKNTLSDAEPSPTAAEHPLDQVPSADLPEALDVMRELIAGLNPSAQSEALKKAWDQLAAILSRQDACRNPAASGSDIANEAESPLANNVRTNAYYMAMIDSFEGHIYICSAQYRIEYMNDRLLERTGHDATGELCHRALHGLESICPWCVNDRVLQGESVQWEVKSPKDGRWYHVSNTPIRHQNGTVSKQAMITDITERKRAEEDLRESEARYRALFEGSMDAIFLTVASGEIAAANPAACALFGKTEEELRRVGRAGIMDQSDPRLSGALKERAYSGKLRCELSCLRGDGSRFTAEISSAILDDSLHAFVLLRDISERIQAQEEILTLNAGLDQRVRERTSELEAAIREQESFSYSVSHDLRAPLRHINSSSAILIEDNAADLPDEACGYLERIVAATRKMGVMIDQLLELSRVNRTGIMLSTVDLSALATAIATMLRESNPRRRVEFSIEEGVLVQGDRALLTQLLENLLGNAWKYSSGRTSARIGFGRTRMAGQEVLFVKDDGVGFDMAYSGQLFEIFQRLHGPEFEGTGIGLATAERIVKRHGGKIWAAGTVGEGATFYFALPIQ